MNRLGILIVALVAATIHWPNASAQDGTLQIARFSPDAGIETQLGDLYGPLRLRDASLYRDIFALQSDGQWRKADQLIDRLGNDLLLGHVQAQRYLHPTDYRSSFEELRDWLAAYADLPQATVIHRLALKRRPANADMPAKPVKGYLGGSGQELVQESPVDYVSPIERSDSEATRIANWLSKISNLVSRDRPTQATKQLETSVAKSADDVEFDIARWLIARGYFANQKDQLALQYASEAAKRSGKIEPRMHWTAGLAAWRLGRIRVAANHFSALARSKAPAEDVAAGAFWAARAYQALREFGRHQAFLKLASDVSDDFYGQLAQKITGASSSFNWHEDGLRGEMRGLIARFPATRRAMALAQAGQNDSAAKEIRKLAARATPELTQALAALAESLSLPAAQMRVAQRVRLLDGRRHDGAMYPLPPWRPTGGFRVDRAVLFALARAESGFNPSARSHAGARGLLQILPSTARMVAKKYGIAYNRPSELDDPVTNLDIGQAYVRRLLENRLVQGNLLHLVVAYNAGLKRLEDWDERLHKVEDDPLLFLESIPIPETRQYAKKVMANLWAYRARLDQDRTSLTQLAQSDWPSYQPAESGPDYAWAR